MNKEKIIQKVSKFLSSRQIKILKMRLEGCALQEIGEEFGRTRERIRQIGKQITRKIGKNFTQEELKDYIHLIKKPFIKRHKNHARFNA